MPDIDSGTRRRIRPAMSALALAAALALPSAADPPLAPPVAALLREIGFSARDLATLRRGAAVTASLDTPAREEIAHVAAVHLQVTPAEFLRRFRDIERFEQGPGVPHLGRFSTPPRLADLDGLSLPDADVAALQSCRPGDCALKLPAPALLRFRQEVDWASAAEAHQASVLTRILLLDLVHAYQSEGNRALGAYVDKDESLEVEKEVRAVLARRDRIPVAVPSLFAFLEDYPASRPPELEDFIYWSVVTFGLKPTIRVSHVALLPLTGPHAGPVTWAIAIKQLYASHYFRTTLELRFLLGDRDGAQGTTLVSLTRSRNDGMTGLGGLFVRPIVERRSRDGVRGYLEHIKRQVEQPAR
ncbi:MAG: hypothetical protein FJW23_16310 [Acidimicrobiia bacterium]|nr:hypothetical protein [Acidimicrobiia bacterium]